MQKSNEKENEKTGAGCQVSSLAIILLFVGKKGKELP